MTTKHLGISLLALVGLISFLAYSNNKQDKKLLSEQQAEQFAHTSKIQNTETKQESESQGSNSPKERQPSVLGVNDISDCKTNKDIPISAESGIIMNAKTGKILYAKNHLEKRPIASLTKLMSALVYLDITNNASNFEEVTTIYPDEYTIGGTLQVNDGEALLVKDLFHVALLGSANNTTNALVRTTDIERGKFIELMNAKADELELVNTIFTDPTGLEPENSSTLEDVSKLAAVAFQNELISSTTSEPTYDFTFLHSGREKSVKNTNALVRNHPEIHWLGSKTGYLDEARYCLIVKIEHDGNEYILGVLGGASEQGHFQDILTLYSAIQNNEL